MKKAIEDKKASIERLKRVKRQGVIIADQVISGFAQCVLYILLHRSKENCTTIYVEPKL